MNSCRGNYSREETIRGNKVCTFLLFFLWVWLIINDTIAESFYSVKYGSSIITSNVCQIISLMKTKTLVFSEKLYFKNSSFWHFNLSLSWNIYFTDITEKKNTNLKSIIIWRNNWLYIIWRSRRTRINNQLKGPSGILLRHSWSPSETIAIFEGTHLKIIAP